MTSAEGGRFAIIVEKLIALRTILATEWPADANDTSSWFDFLVRVKQTMGNQHNDLSFLAALMAKVWLKDRFDLPSFDAAEKPIGANGLDLDLSTASGQRIVCEIKTTHPYLPGFGSAQQREIDANLRRLSEEAPAFKFMLVTDANTFDTLRRNRYHRFPGVKVVNILSNDEFTL